MVVAPDDHSQPIFGYCQPVLGAAYISCMSAFVFSKHQAEASY